MYDPADNASKSYNVATEALRERLEKSKTVVGACTLYNEDNRFILPTIAANSVDSIVTDPPYHLTSIVKRFGASNSAPAAYGSDGRFKRLSGGFMNAKWDAPDEAPIDAGFAHWFAGFVDGEGCFSVHKKTVNGCETYDCQFSITVRADDKPIIVDIQRQLGGIGSLADRPARPGTNGKPQVRYCISSKADCQRLQAILQVFPLRAKKARDFEIWSEALDAWVAHEPKSGWDNIAYYRDALMAVRKYGSNYHASELFHYRWAYEAFRVLKPGGHLLAFGGTRTYHRMACAIEDAGFEIRDCIAWVYGSGFPKSHNLSDEWGGWGTALKPAFEPIIVARKPLSEKSVAANVLKYGTGALNIDASRVVALDGYTENAVTQGINTAQTSYEHRRERRTFEPSQQGRWPANFIHDGSDEVVRLFPETTAGKVSDCGLQHSGRHGGLADVGPNIKAESNGIRGHSDNVGSAARFFYCAKADKDDRLKSKHPTVKPIDLMAYLVRLVTQPGGTVLDPFSGSGSTCMACMREGMNCIAIEREEEYFTDILHRVSHVRGEDTPLFAHAEVIDDKQLDLEEIAKLE